MKIAGPHQTGVEGETWVGEVHLLNGVTFALEAYGTFEVFDLSGGRWVRSGSGPAD